MTRYGFLIRVDLCVGCKVCTNACKDEFEDNEYLPWSAPQPESSVTYGPSFYPTPASTLSVVVQPGQEWISVPNSVSGTFPNVTSKYIPTPCQHCSNPPCVTASKNSAVYARPDGIVIIDPDKSSEQSQLGQPSACPYGKIYWNVNASLPQKCTFCAHLIDQGKTPRCVEACPVAAISFGDLSNSSSTISQAIKSLGAKQLHPEYGTSPNAYYVGL